MAYFITDPCIGTKDTACVDVCPVDCIHPRKDEPDFARSPMLFIDPENCIDCGACVPVCPVAAIYNETEVPVSQALLVEANRIYRTDDEATFDAAEALVKKHIEADPDLMSLSPPERALEHNK